MEKPAFFSLDHCIGVRAQLREALEARAPLRVLRDRISPNWVHGHVIGLSAEFCLIAEVSDAMRFDGFIALALGDITAVEEDPGREFVDRALALNNESIPELAQIRLEDWQTIAESAAAMTPLTAASTRSAPTCSRTRRTASSTPAITR